MLVDQTRHPDADELRAFGKGLLAPEAAVAIEQHLAACDSCCGLLEEPPADSFVGRLRDAAHLSGATTTGAASGTLADAASVPPELLDHPRYRVLGLVGQGGMGAVYRAEHRRMERAVALKVINPALTRNPATVQRFQQEARTAARLHHPNIVTAHDADQAGALHFLVMEHVEGRSLADLIHERGPLPVAEACDYVRQAALGLQHAHEQGMVHRDIKPHNLMVTPSGQVKILDFGLARLARSPEDATDGAVATETALTGAGAIMGTADYIAPEQAADPRAADIRADLYSLGCTLFHLLAGRPPFPDGNVQDKLAKHANDSMPSLAALRPDVPAGLAAVLAQMTAKNPADRYQTPAAVVEALTPFAKPQTERPRVRKRRPLLAVALLMLAVGAALAGAVVVRVTTERGDIVITTHDKALELTVGKGGDIVRIHDPRSGQTWEVDTKKYRIAVANEPNGLVVELPGHAPTTLYRRNGELVAVIDFSGTKPQPMHLPTAEELAQRENSLDSLKPEDVPESVRTYIGNGDPKKSPPELVAVLGDTRFRCSGRPGPMAFTPDGKQICVSDGMGQIRFLDAATGRLVRQITCAKAPHSRMAFSADGRRLAGITANGAFVVIDPETGNLIWQLKPPGAPDPSQAKFAISADGKTILLNVAQGNLQNYDVESGKQLGAWATEVNVALAVSPDGKAGVAITIAARAWLYNLSMPDDKARAVQRDRDGKVDTGAQRIAYRPDGQGFAIAWSGNEVTSHDRQGKLLHTLTAADGELDLLAFTADSKMLLTVNKMGTGETVVDRWDVAGLRKLSTATVPRAAGRRDAVISPDGKTLAATFDNVVLLWDTATGKRRNPDPGHTAEVADLAFSADGKLLAAADRRGVRIWDLKSGKSIVQWEGAPWNGSLASRPIAFHPNNKEVAVAQFAADASPLLPRIVRIRNLETHEETSIQTGHVGRIRCLAYSPDGKYIATGSEDHTTRVWRVANDSYEEVAILGHSADVWSIAWSPDGRLLASVDAKGTIVVRDGADEGKLFRFWPSEGANSWTVPHLAFLADGKTLAIAASMSPAWPKEWHDAIWLVDARTGKIESKLAQPRPADDGDGAYLGSFTFGPLTTHCAVWNRDGAVVLQQLSNPIRQRIFHLGNAVASPPNAVAFSPDGRYLATGNPDGTICLLRLAERGQVPDLPVVPKPESIPPPRMVP